MDLLYNTVLYNGISLITLSYIMELLYNTVLYNGISFITLSYITGTPL